MSMPERLDLLNWLAAQPPGPPLAAPTRAAVHTTAISAPVLLTRVDPSCNMHRFYSAALATSLLGEVGVVRHWGRIGSQGRSRSRTEWYEGSRLAKAARQRLLSQKKQRGYVVVGES
jgi:predicted DNA-binding WGR domain protein